MRYAESTRTLTACAERLSKIIFSSLSASAETGFILSADASMISPRTGTRIASAEAPNFSAMARSARRAPARLFALALPLSASSVLH